MILIVARLYNPIDGNIFDRFGITQISIVALSHKVNVVVYFSLIQNDKCDIYSHLFFKIPQHIHVEQYNLTLATITYHRICNRHFTPLE